MRPRLGGVSGTPRVSDLRVSSSNEKESSLDALDAPRDSPRTMANDSTPLDSFLAALLLKGVRWDHQPHRSSL